jgi:PAS domain S-box-containing protein
MKNLFNIPIRAKLYISTFFLLAAISLFILLFFPARLHRQALHALHSRAESIAAMSAYALAPAYLFNDSTGIREVFESAKQSRDLAYIVIEDKNGTVHNHWNLQIAQAYTYHTLSLEDRWVGDIFKVRSPLVVNNHEIAAVYLGLSVAPVTEDVSRSRLMIVFISVIVLVVGFLVSFWIASLVTNPLRQMVETVQKIDAGDLSQRAPVVWGDEIGILAKSFNKMVDNVLSVRSLLADMNHTLEDRVKHRTLQLQKQILEHEKTKEALQRRETIIEAVALAAEKFLYASDWRAEINEVLQALGQATHTGHVWVFECIDWSNERRILRVMFEWSNINILPLITNPSTAVWDFGFLEAEPWRDQLLHDEIKIWKEDDIRTLNHHLPIPHDVTSILFSPIMVNKEWWGVIGFSERNIHRTWTSVEIDTLKTAARILGTAMERQLAEEALRSSEEHYRRFFEEDITGNFIVKPTGVVQACNPAFMKTFGFPSHEKVLDSNFRSFFFSDELFERWMMDVMEKRVLTYYQMTLRRLDGQTIYAIANIIGRYSKDDQLVEIQGYLFDDTKRRELEEQLIQSQKIEELGTLAGGIAHDFNNILAIIEAYTSLLKLNTSNSEMVEQSTDAITKATVRGANLVKQLLTFARRTKTEFQPVFINEIVQELHKFILQTFPKTNLVQIQLTPQLPPILADPTQMHQVLLNLCVNARDAMPEGGSLKLKTSLVEGRTVSKKIPKAQAFQYIQIDVTDTGTGMDDQVKKRLFEPFFTTKEIGKGTGLGLAVVFGIVQSHTGFIDVYSMVDIGTTFSIFLPVPPNREQFLKIQTAEESTASLNGTETILLVEDEDAIRDYLLSILKTYHYKVYTAGDGLEALEMYDKHFSEIDVVISDIGLPKLGGEQLAYRLKAKRPQLPIIIVSGYVEPEMDERLQQGGLHHILHKPYQLPTLLSLLRTLLEVKENKT